VWQHKTKHIIITDNKFITTYVILSFTLSHHIHNIGIYMSNKHSHTLLIHMTNTHSLIKSIHIVSYTYKTWNRTHWNIESSYQDLHIWRRHEIVQVMFTIVRSDVEESLNKWVPWSAPLFTRCSHSGRWSLILQLDVIIPVIRNGFW
jgi:hypothetical protein